MDWIIRGGIATPERLIKGYTEHLGVPGLYGFSVQYHPGTTVDELAQARQFPNGKLSIAYDTDVQNAIKPLGYTLELRRSPGRGYHYTLAVLYDASGVMLQILPPDAAEALAQSFQVVDNPYQGDP